MLYCLIVAVPFCIRNLLNSRLGLSGCFRFGAPALKCFDLFGIEYKIWTSPDLNSMRWLGLFTNKTFRKHLKLNFPHRDFIFCIVSLAIFQPHFVIHIFPSAFFHPPSAIRRHLVRTLQRSVLINIYAVSGCLFCFFFRSLFYLAEVIFSSKSRKESLELMFSFKV